MRCSIRIFEYSGEQIVWRGREERSILVALCNLLNSCILVNCQNSISKIYMSNEKFYILNWGVTEHRRATDDAIRESPS